jgi:hypothetical protein
VGQASGLRRLFKPPSQAPSSGDEIPAQAEGLPHMARLEDKDFPQEGRSIVVVYRPFTNASTASSSFPASAHFP